MAFPKDFIWGASTAAYQIEGGNDRSALWDWEVRKGWERSGDAARSWDLFEEDLKLIKELGLKAYRFSVEWSRVEPARGEFDQAALARYAAWARRLNEEGVKPWVCLHHFSEPKWLLQAHPDGWLDEGVADDFLRFVGVAARALAPHVADWVVFNEPTVFMVGAYGFPYFPPGRLMLTNVHKDFIPRVVPQFARAHNDAYDLIKKARPDARVGVAQNVAAIDPARPQDGEAAKQWDWFMHRQFLDLIKDKLDFVGLNYYTRIFVRKAFVPFAPLGVIPGYAELEKGLTPLLFKLVGGRRDARPRNGMGWEIVPEGFERVLVEYSRSYNKPVYVLENGMAEPSQMSRENFLREHLSALAKAMAAGADVRGYFHWSLIDNYEWGSYRPRFGLYSRDRKPNDGAALYGRVCRTGEIA
jgi:beta-glucosidase